jgi:hypothetical protein
MGFKTKQRGNKLKIFEIHKTGWRPEELKIK